MKHLCLVFSLLVSLIGMSQTISKIPVYQKEDQRFLGDWLIQSSDVKTQLYQTVDGKLVFSNGLVSRTFTTKPNCATVSLDLLSNNESFLRSVRPEAELTINGRTFAVGGLKGQPIHNYLLPEWIEQMTADPLSFKLQGYRLEETKARFPWKKRMSWMPKDMPWPAPGKELIFTYRLDEQAIGLISEIPPVDSVSKFAFLKDIEVSVHYELYDQMPVFCKWITVENKSSHTIRINRFKSEILAANEPESTVDSRKSWIYPNITIETDYNFGGMSDESILESSVAWNVDSLYQTQVNYERKMPCLLEVYPKYGPDQELASGSSFSSYRTWELIHDSWDRERKGLEHRRMMKAMAPWVTENPILMHVRSADNKAVKIAVDQCAEVGFEKVIMTFGSGFNTEDTSSENIGRMKMLADYAHSKGISLGGYSLLASRSINRENDVVMPEGKTPRFGNSPCIESDWGQSYFKQLYNFFEKTELDNLEHDGSYPGDICASTQHPGHRGLDDSQWNQYRRITDFYKWCRGKGIYLNVPDYYFLSGSSKTGMGYRETNWSLPREQQEIIERQNIYDGTWHKSPSMGWMFVPLVEYQGGGKEATIEPLKDHLPHYQQRLANLFGAGVQACYRGPQLYDTPETKELVKKWVTFYKKYRRILDGDIIHVRRPDGRDYDAILHVDPQGDPQGLLMVYNPLNESISRKIKVNLYYTGLKNQTTITDGNGNVISLPIDSDSSIWLNVEIPEKSQTWYVFE